MFSHEKLEVYKRSLEFMDLISPVFERLPRGQRHIADQLKRASISILLNIAEGAGKSTPDEKRRFYSMARGSALECAAVLDLLLRWGLAETTLIASCKETLHEVVSMLSTLVLRELETIRGR